jgi:4-hydroxybenzoate polyprenyltransferase
MAYLYHGALSILSTYIFFIWFYSHKIKYPVVESNGGLAGCHSFLLYCCITITTSFEEFEITKAICRYFCHASFLTLLTIHEMIKDLEN